MARDDGTMDPLAEDGSVECPTCSRSFPNFGLVEKHEVEVHGAEETMICRLGCDTLFKRRMTVIFHVRSQKHRGAAWIGCEICDAFTITNGFPNEKVLKEHATKIHGKDIVLPPKSQDSNVACPLCKRKFAQRKALIEHIQVLHTEHLYGNLMGLSGDAKQEFLDNKLFTCDACLPDQQITFKAKSALNRHCKRFHTKEALKRRAMSASPSKATNSKASRPSKSPVVKRTRRSVATAPVTPVTPVTPATPKTPIKSEPVAASVSKVSPDGGNKNPLLKTTPEVAKTTPEIAKTTPEVLKTTPEEAANKGTTNRNPLLTNGLSKSSPLKTSGGIFKQPLSTPRPTKSLITQKSTNPTRSSLPPTADRTSKCNFCQKSFTRESILNVHVEMIHKKEKMELEMKTKEKDEQDGSSPALSTVADVKDEKELKPSEKPADIMKEEAPVLKDSVVSKVVSDAETADSADAPITVSSLTNGCETIESEEESLESEEEVFMEVEEEDIDLTNHPNLVEKKTCGVVVDKEWKGAYLSRKKADADAPSEENKRISARLREKVSSNNAAKRKEVSRETPPAVTKKRRKKAETVEVIKKGPQELNEECLYSEEQWGGCKRKFYSYFSMMRHVAFVHRPERTVEIMRIRNTAQPIKNPAMPILMELEAKKKAEEVTVKAEGGGAPESGSTTASSATANKESCTPPESTSSTALSATADKESCTPPQSTSTAASSPTADKESPPTSTDTGESPNNAGSSPESKTEKGVCKSREDVKAVIEEMVEAVVKGEEAPSEGGQVQQQVAEGNEVSPQGAVGKPVKDDDENVPPQAVQAGAEEAANDETNGVPAENEPEAVKDPKAEDVLDDTVEMEIAAAAAASEVVVAN